MNRSIVERMVREGDLSIDALQYLLQCRCEFEWLDYKEDLPLERDKQLCEFAKDVIALKNTGGGYLVVGVKDKSWEAVGIPAPLPYDTKGLRDKIRRASGLDLDVDIVHHEIQQLTGKAIFAVIFVRASRKRSKRRMPSLVVKDYCRSEVFGLRHGDIYVRRVDSTVRVKSQEELEELLDSLEAQADQDALEASERPSPFAVDDGTYRLLDKGFDSFIGRQQLREELLRAIGHDPRIWIINVHGPGGVGKSALVSWAAYELYRTRTFEAILQLTAKDTILTDTGIGSFSRSLYSLENLLDHLLTLFQEPPTPDLEKKKQVVTALLSAWKTLLVLDNMETLGDARVLKFVQDLPPDSRTKVLLTSRTKTGGWEYPVAVTELDTSEVREFLKIKSEEIGVEFPLSSGVVTRVKNATGGLPLAVQWIMGRYKVQPNLEEVLSHVARKDSPILEFSFRNVWRVLSPEARAVLAVMSIFDGPATLQDIAIATEFGSESIEKALEQLADVTLVSRHVEPTSARASYSALPITLSFAQHELAEMGDFEAMCRRRHKKFSDQMELRESEVGRFRSITERYGLDSQNEKRAAILCKRGESEMFTGNIENAGMLFVQARELAPQSPYVYAMSASYELANHRVGVAKNLAQEACRRANKKTGALCYTILARVLDEERDRGGRVGALEKALQYDPSDVILRHQYGVALSRAGQEDLAIAEFTKIINAEINKVPVRSQLLMALKTRIINLRRRGRIEEAKRDLDLAKELIARHKHLYAEARHIADLEDE